MYENECIQLLIKKKIMEKLAKENSRKKKETTNENDHNIDMVNKLKLIQCVKNANVMKSLK